jgi:hypothetical protein
MPTKAKPKPAPRPKRKPEPKPEPKRKPEPKPEPKPKRKPKPEPKPAPKPKRRAAAAAARPRRVRADSPATLRRTFARDMSELLRADPRVAEVRTRAADFALELDLHGGETTVMFLENYFQESAHLDPGEREARVLARMAAVLRPIEGTASFASVAARLLPVLRSQSFFRAGSGDVGIMPAPAAQPFVPFIDLGLVLDEDDRMSYVSSGHLAEWGVALEDALLQAFANASRLAAPVSDDDGATFHIDAGDDHESSRLAIPGFLASFRGYVDGEPLAIMPSRSQLWIAGSEDPSLVLELTAVAAREYESANRAISPALYTVDGTGEVVPFHVAPSHPAYHAVRLCHLKLQVHEYDAQKAELDAHFAHDGIDVFVAAINGIIRTDGLPLTWTFWGDGIDSLLPAADLICFASPTGRRKDLYVPFAAAQDILGPLLVPSPHYRPARYRVRAHPTGEHMARLRAAAVTIDGFSPS